MRVLAVGDFALYDSTRPYQLLFDDAFEQIVLKLPGERLRSELRDTERLTATTVSGREGAGHLLIGHDPHAARRHRCAAARVGAGGGQRRAAASWWPGCRRCPRRASPASEPAHGLPPGAHQAAHRRAAGRPRADRGSLAAELGLSASQIHRVFKNEPLTPAQYIWERRLDAASRDLLEPRLAGRSVAEIAFGRGFSDAAHFSRAFRDRFGCSPREWRLRH